MTLDDAVKISQIFIPVVIAWIGYFLSANLNAQTHSNKLTSDFNTKWSEKYISKCLRFSDLVTDVTTNLFLLSQNDRENKDKVISRIGASVNNLQKAEYEVQVYSELVEGTEDTKRSVELLFGQLRDLLKDKQGDLEAVKSCQRKLHRQLKTLQKQTLNL